MLSELTIAKIDHGLAKLALDQATGQAPPPGQVTVEDLARRADVSPATVYQFQKMALAKFAAALLAQPDLPPHVVKRLSARLDP